MSLLRPILKRAILAPRRTISVDDQRAYSYAKLIGAALHVAGAIEKRTDQKHIGIMLPTSGAFPVALLGCWLAGRVAVPMNYLLGREELHYIIADSGVDTLLTAGRMLDHVFEHQGEDAIPQHVHTVKLEELSFAGLPPLRWPPNPADDELALLLYTSGTSGKPKGVMLTHGNLESNARAAIAHARIKRADTFLGVLPQFHSFGVTVLTLLPLLIGAKVVYTARFVPRKLIDLIREHRPDIFVAVPSMYGALLSVKNAGPEDFTSLRFAISGAEPLPDSVFERFRERFGVEILEGFGLTETSPATHWSTPWAHKRHSVGKALPGVRTFVLDDAGQPLPPNTDGEIALAGPNVMAGYYHLPELNDEVFTEIPASPDGSANGAGVWGGGRVFKTGDIGHVDEEGFLFITGRKKEMLIVGGENVFPREIEEVLVRHPTIAAAAVIGKHDDVRGEVPIAFVEMKDGAELDESALKTHCREHLTGFKVPREIRAVAQLPRNGTGKILRRELKA